ncbi:MAG: hypothetical protein FWD46_01115 [Cystobacterineae bacterium]|nr:hypothetical protein [Cystobacterineae bacterium]
MQTLRSHSLNQWREDYMGYMWKVDFEPFNDIPFHIAFHFPLGLPGMVDCCFSAGTLVRTSEITQNEEDVFQLVSPGRGALLSEQRGRQLQLRRNEATLLYGAERSRLGSPTGIRGIGIMAPREEFEKRSVRPDDAVMTPPEARLLALPNKPLLTFPRPIE